MLPLEGFQRLKEGKTILWKHEDPYLVHWCPCLLLAIAWSRLSAFFSIVNPKVDVHIESNVAKVKALSVEVVKISLENVIVCDGQLCKPVVGQQEGNLIRIRLEVLVYNWGLTTYPLCSHAPGVPCNNKTRAI